jgi:hypothetical protein
MGSAFMLGIELVKLATQHGWSLSPILGEITPTFLKALATPALSQSATS